MLEEIQQSISRSTLVGAENSQFAKERITTGQVNESFGSNEKVETANVFISWNENETKNGDQVVELKDDRAPFDRLLVSSKARDISLKDAVGTYEFSAVPRALFAANGSLLHTASKSDSMSILEELPGDNAMPELMDVRPAGLAVAWNKCIAIVD